MVVQSPLDYPATLTPMEPRVVLAIVDAIAEAGVTLAGVNGDAATERASLGNGVNDVVYIDTVPGNASLRTLGTGRSPRHRGSFTPSRSERSRFDDSLDPCISG